ncbi:stalk domain-containing protein [Paenibacillus senegalensis]|uniref:stalk domain-containing protein n=1 Tax=Paenibacillus senegalensis TaxID=1465766 RepID=UPI000287B43A|nr:stalk domain-containing protein [Paenibacillus senegalensis]
MIQRQEQTRKKWRKRAAAILLAAGLIMQSWTVMPSPAEASGKVTYQGQEIISAGAILKKYNYTSTRKGKTANVKVNVVEIALQNPYIHLDVMTGQNDKFTKPNTVKGMASDSGAIAGVNGDFYNTKADLAPMGPQITNNEIRATPNELPGFYSFGVTMDNRPIIDTFTFTGWVTAANGNSYNLGGVNKTYYWFEPSGQHSMIDSIFLYTDAWGSPVRANDGVTVPTEVLVQDGIVQDIRVNGVLDMTPPEDGYILRASGKGAEFVINNLSVGEPVSAEYNIIPRDPTKSYKASDFKMLIGGHTILVDNGKPTSYSRSGAEPNGFRARTAVGFSQDEKFAYLINVEDNGSSAGMSFAELQDVMIQIGVWKGINLDGGGSSQMVARPLGELGVQLVGIPESNYQRRVVNGIGVFTTAPKGEALGLKISGPDSLFLNEPGVYTARGYDVYYNPIPQLEDPAQWSVSDNAGTFADNVYTPTRKGTSTIHVTSGQAKASTEVNVVQRKDIARLQIIPSSSVLIENGTIDLAVKAWLRDGTERVIPAASFDWNMRGFEGEVVGDQLIISSLDENYSGGQLIATYDGFSTILDMTPGVDKLWTDFEENAPHVSFSSTLGVDGDVSIVEGMLELPAGQHAAQMTVNFVEEAIGTLAAYTEFGTDGIVLEGQPQSMSLDVWGDASNHWLRAELIDAGGKTHRVDLAKQVDWLGWRTVSGDFSSFDMAYPVKLTRLYVADIDEGRETRARQSTIGFDNLSFRYKSQDMSASRNKVSLTIDQSQIVVNGQRMQIDQAPVLIDGNTLVPIRFVVEAMGGEVVPWQVGDVERKVTIYRDGNMAEFWLDQLDTVINGELVTAEVPPQLINERTMVPLRILSENFGWKVSWDQPTLTVTLE